MEVVSLGQVQWGQACIFAPTASCQWWQSAPTAPTVAPPLEPAGGDPRQPDRHRCCRLGHAGICCRPDTDVVGSCSCCFPHDLFQMRTACPGLASWTPLIATCVAVSPSDRRTATVGALVHGGVLPNNNRRALLSTRGHVRMYRRGDSLHCDTRPEVHTYVPTRRSLTL